MSLSKLKLQYINLGLVLITELPFLLVPWYSLLFHTGNKRNRGKLNILQWKYI